MFSKHFDAGSIQCDRELRGFGFYGGDCHELLVWDLTW
jgi:hypothetical protein